MKRKYVYFIETIIIGLAWVGFISLQSNIAWYVNALSGFIVGSLSFLLPRWAETIEEPNK